MGKHEVAKGGYSIEGMAEGMQSGFTVTVRAQLASIRLSSLAFALLRRVAAAGRADRCGRPDDLTCQAPMRCP